MGRELLEEAGNGRYVREGREPLIEGGCESDDDSDSACVVREGRELLLEGRRGVVSVTMLWWWCCLS